MKKFLQYFPLLVLLTALLQTVLFADVAPSNVSMDQRIVITKNDMVKDGQLVIQYQVRANNIPQAAVSKTLGSATIDILYNNTKLQYSTAGSWAFTPGQGYARAVTNNGTFVRIGVTGGSVNGNEDDGTIGYDMPTDYVKWVQITFLIKDPTGTTNLTIDPATNAIGLFQDHSNSLLNGIILDVQNLNIEDATDIPLPITLTNFTANQSGNTIKLNWETATEVDNYGFQIERKSPSSDVWENLGIVKGHGNSNTGSSYSYEDKKLVLSGKYSYRLKQLDNNGDFKYSQTVEVAFTSRNENFALEQNYPNPFNPATKISYCLPKESHVKLTVFNSLGEVVKELVNGIQVPGVCEVSFSASEMPSGIYFYQIEADPLDGSKSFSEVKRMLFIK
ncbi:MAG: T9SS type A sorting domain-containing protein [Bacteroidota bacterium]|nr:T9SS type A sorting domain-containing protein [Bacteroidota bacterium]